MADHPDTVVCVYCGRKGTRRFVVSSGDPCANYDKTTWRCESTAACERRHRSAEAATRPMSRGQAAREARALVAEWIWAVRATDEGWQECYTPADLALVKAEIDKIEERFEGSGPSLFHRLAAKRANSRD
jgi:hypothetical protein